MAAAAIIQRLYHLQGWECCQERDKDNELKVSFFLAGRTIHTLYAFSFVIYAINIICDWVHTCMTCR